ncbi:MAG: sterol carrier protein domain-containing protein [Planctomycetota bacterium]|nr:sterol carrier protein domain-containing protein [Planctomycetota bacterium]
MSPRAYDPDRDFDALFLLLREAGWAQDSKRNREAHRLYVDSGRFLVSDVNGGVESFASTHAGTVRYLAGNLPVSVVSGVITGRVARRRGLGLRVTAEAVAADAADGVALSVLGIFDQGYYDRIGYATGPYDVFAMFDPGDLRLRTPASGRAAVRLDASDWERIHASRISRRQVHGSLSMTDGRFTQYDVMQREKGFGLGFEAAPGGELTHHVFAVPDTGGSWLLPWIVFHTPDQFAELMGLLASLGDQVQRVRFIEPPRIQTQRIVARPFRRRGISTGGKAETGHRAFAWWQGRIVDLPACVAAMRLPGDETVEFRLELTDPIADYLAPETRKRWAGVGGAWAVTLGPESHAEPAAAAASGPVLRTSVNTFTQLWLGVSRPADLAYLAPDLDVDDELLARLDRIVRLPTPHLDWDV